MVPDKTRQVTFGKSNNRTQTPKASASFANQHADFKQKFRK
ncbi:MAG: hypothetical protein ACJAWM_000001 [Sulfitobacter sp.]|jgi:hypothetical protein